MPWSSESRSCCAALPSCPSRSPFSVSLVSSVGSRCCSAAVVSVTAATPRETNGACSESEYGNASERSCWITPSRIGGSPVSSRTRWAAVRTSTGEAVIGRSLSMASRGRALPPSESSATTAAILSRYAGSCARWAAPTAPYAPPSVETNRSVCAGRTRPVGAPAVAGCAYARASSTSAAVPEALSTTPPPKPISSRCASTTITRGERPGTRTSTFVSVRLPSPGISASNCCRSERNP